MTTSAMIGRMADEEYMPVEDVARVLGVKTRQAHRYSEQGRIRTKHIGPHNVDK